MDQEMVLKVRQHYLRDEVMARIFEVCEDREVVPVFYGTKYGQRPSCVQFMGDLERMAKAGATSFHCSVEHWKNPLLLSNTSSKADMTKIRKCWDLIFDIDADMDFEHGRIAARLLIDELRAHGIKNVSVKFSGRRGFHVGVSYRALPENIAYTYSRAHDSGRSYQHVSELYPELLQRVAGYLRDRISENLAQKLLEFDSSLTEKMGPEKDPYRILDIEQNWSNRHLFRMPYSLNEKTWNVSIPLNPAKLSSFKIDDAKIENVKADVGFLDKWRDNEAEDLVADALEWEAESLKKTSPSEEKMTKLKAYLGQGGTFIESGAKRKVRLGEHTVETRQSRYMSRSGDAESLLFSAGMKIKDSSDFMVTEKIGEECFPPCIKKILEGLPDGRKRSIFVLINFLRSAGWGRKEVEEKLEEWNKKNPDPISDSYIAGQVNYSMKNAKSFPPPACENKGYYSDLQVCSPDPLCQKIKNPIGYALVKSKSGNKRKRSRSKKSSNKKDQVSEKPRCEN